MSQLIKTCIKKPHLYFIALAAMCLSLFMYSKYYIITYNFAYLELKNYQLHLLSVLFFCMIALNYYALVWTNKKPNSILTTIHIVLLTIALVPFLALTLKEGSSINAFLKVAIVVFVASIIIHVFNFFKSLLLAN